MKRIYKLSIIFFIISLSIFSYVFINKNIVYAEDVVFDIKEEDITLNENWGGFPKPKKLILKTTRVSKNKFKVYMKVEFSEAYLNFGGSWIKFYINDNLVNEQSGNGYWKWYSHEADINGVNEAKDRIRYKIEYGCSYGTFNNKTTLYHTTSIYDNKKPEIQITKAITNNKNITVSATVNRRVSRIYYKIPAGQDYIAKDGGNLTVIANDDGEYYFYAEDESGNKSDIKKVYYDSKAPVITGAVDITKNNVTVSAIDPHFLNLYYIFNSGNTVTLTNNTVTFDKEGIYDVWAKDSLGNTSSTKRVIIDRTVPVINSYKRYINSEISISFNDKHLKTIYIKKPNGDILTSDSNNIKVPEDIDGDYILWAEDKAGNRSADNIITVDKKVPIINSYKEYINKETEISFNEKHPNKIYVTNPKGELKTYNGSKYIQSIEFDGKWQIQAEDKAGNKSDISYIIIDTIKPIIGLRKANGQALVDGGFNNTGVYFDPADANYKEIKLYRKELNDNYTLISSDYIVGTVYFDKREELNLFDSKNSASEYIISKEMLMVKSHNNWTSDIVGIILDDQKDLALQGLSYYTYEKDDESKYIFFEYNRLIDFIKNTVSLEYLKSSSREVFNEEGSFKIEAYDKAGNLSFKTFTIDKQIPTGAFANVINGGITNKSEVIFRFEESDLIIKDNDKKLEPIYENLSKKYVIKIKDVGMHNLKLEDRAGNISTYSILIDREKIAAFDVKNIKLNDLVYSNSNSYVVILKDSVGIKSIKLNGSDLEIKNTRLEKVILNDEKEYSIEACDKAGNISNFKIIIDRVKPDIEILGEHNKEDNRIYSNKKLQFKFNDDKKLKEVRLNGKVVSNDINIGDEDGEYEIKAIDMAGNINKKTFIRFTKDNFGNRDIIKNGYKIVSWYKVTLPGYIFNIQGKENISGVYNFLDKDSAMEFAKKKEIEYRVTKTNIAEWIYASVSNESISQKYTDERLLNEAVEYYAKKYVSDKIYRKIYQDSDIGRILNSEGIYDDAAFTLNLANIPMFLDEYKELSIYQINSSFVFSSLKNDYLIKSLVKLKYLADDFKIKDNVDIILNQNESILDGLNRFNNIKQGYYLVSEYDICLNKEEYLIYLDFENPKLECDILLGDNTKKNILIDDKYVKANLNTMRFIEFNISNILDNIDNGCLLIEIQGNKISRKFDKSDSIPILSYKNGYQGEYKITLYDRSDNQLSFTVYIAGLDPTMEHSSLSSHNQKLFIDFKINDKSNSFEIIELYKVNFDGTKSILKQDSENNEINAGRRHYVITNGGKYQARLVDLYKRKVWTRAVFFQKGLPIGTLSITNETYTNKNVTFSYQDKFVLKVYEIKGDNKKLINNYPEEFNDTKKRYTAVFFAKPNTDKITYLLNLSDKDDPSMYIEYSFGIDTLISETRVVEKDTNRILEKGNATNKGFIICYEDSDLEIKYSLSGGLIKSYKKDEVLDKNGIYHVRVVDYVGNFEEFDIYVDTKVDVVIKGSYKFVDDKYLSKDDIEILAREMLSRYEVKLNGHIKNIPYGDKLVDDGEYEIKLTDKYGNESIVNILIDKTKPKIKLLGVNDKNISKDKVIIISDANKLELYRKSSFIKSINNEDNIFDEGEYRVVGVDLAGNIEEISFLIDKSINIKLSILKSSVTTDSVYLTTLEDLKIDIKHNGKNLDSNMKVFKDSGDYELNLEDIIGNKEIIKFSILPKGYKEIKVPMYENTRIVKVLKDGIIINKTDNIFKDSGKYEVSLAKGKEEYTINFYIDSILPKLEIKNDRKGVRLKRLNKENSSIKLYKDGKLQEKFSAGALISEPGRYVVEVSDEFGNKSSYDFLIKKHINTYGLIGIGIVLIIIVGGLIYGILSKRVKSH